MTRIALVNAPVEAGQPRKRVEHMGLAGLRIPGGRQTATGPRTSPLRAAGSGCA